MKHYTLENIITGYKDYPVIKAKNNQDAAQYFANSQFYRNKPLINGNRIDTMDESFKVIEREVIDTEQPSGEFWEWFKSDDIVHVPTENGSVFTEQTTQYKKKFTFDELLEFFNKEYGQ